MDCQKQSITLIACLRRDKVGGPKGKSIQSIEESDEKIEKHDKPQCIELQTARVITHKNIFERLRCFKQKSPPLFIREGFKLQYYFHQLSIVSDHRSLTKTESSVPWGADCVYGVVMKRPLRRTTSVAPIVSDHEV